MATTRSKAGKMAVCKFCGARVHVNSIARHEAKQCSLRDILKDKARSPRPVRAAELDRTHEVLEERQKVHGTFSVHSKVAQALKAAMRDSPNWDSLPADAKESLEMIQHKISRVLVGDANYEDHWRDISGYSTLVADDRLGKASA